MNTGSLKKFAQAARRQLREIVAARLEQVLNIDSVEIREKGKVVKDLQEQLARTSKEEVIERMAYIWFNRFCALRFMDINRYSLIGAVSPASGYTHPEILQEAKQGHIEKELDRYLNRQKVFDLLAGRTPSTNPQQEAYRLLLVAVCNYYNTIMPFMFEQIADYTELLMPDDLLSESSILNAVRQAMTPDTCRDVEVIGWLYQFYISEKKDEVINRRSVVTKEEIPAATQLFTPEWIVRFVVENSLGRLWMQNHPQSCLVGRMDYYIKPEQAETDCLQIGKPEELKICDPACGSGHMLVYAFDLLYAIYEEEGYDTPDIPRLILENNLYGIEIDERAGELAAFALFMKAREKCRRFLSKPVQPNICVLENISFEDDELKNYMREVGRDIFTYDLKTTLKQFEEANNFGSMIRPALKNATDCFRVLKEKNLAGNLFLQNTHKRVLQALWQADYLSSKYHVVIANPPYMGSRGMNGRLKVYAKENYPNSKSDLFAMFIERNLEMTTSYGQLGFVTPFVWMFISSYEKLRNEILKEATITNLVQLEYNAFAPACIPVCSFTISKCSNNNAKGNFIKLSEFRGSENQAPKTLEAIKNRDCGWFYRASTADFKRIPSSPIAYWATKRQTEIFETITPLNSWAPVKQGLATADNNRFIRAWHEVPYSTMGLEYKSTLDTQDSIHKWFPYNKGGDFRKWYGNFEFVVLWEKDGHEIRNFSDETGYIRSRAQNTEYYFKAGVTWTFISSSKFGVRFAPPGSVFDVAGSSAFPPEEYAKGLTAFLSSNITWGLLKLLNPTLNFQVGNIASLPVSKDILTVENTQAAERLIKLGTIDWDAFETSWNFTSLPLLHNDYRQDTLKATFAQLRAHWREMTLEMQRLEEENNRIFIEAYGLQDELSPDVPLEEITLTCNPHYRYGKGKSEKEYEKLLLAETMKEFISYAVGCMFGRYSLDKPGLVLANQGETAEHYFAKVPEPTFEPDNDNVIPILDKGWFVDDITERFQRFLRVTFGKEHFEDNLAFIEKAIGKDVRKFFLKDFYNDHVKRYKKRPIYWMFSSPNGSFNALIYMHCYRPDTVSVVLNDYLREFRTKLVSRKDHMEHISISASASQSERTKALKEIETLNKTIDELETYERDILYPLATQQVEIDLDDGVKVNYNKFGKALKKVTGLSG